MNLKAFFIIFATLLAIPSYFAGLYFFTDVQRLNKEYPVWEKIDPPWYTKIFPGLHRHDADSHPYRIRWEKEKPAHWISISNIPKRTRQAFLTSEDSKFYSHHGFDWESIQKVLEKYRKSGQKGRLAGASTISQQVVKNVFLNNERSWWRKIRETLLTMKMEDNVKKDKILEVYFNIAEMGEDLHGIKAASTYYFHKAPSNLSYRESVFIASLLPNPKVYSRSFRMKRLSPYMSKRMRQLLHMMYRAHMMDVGTYVAEVGARFSWERVATMKAVEASEIQRPENQTEVEIEAEDDLDLGAKESEEYQKDFQKDIEVENKSAASETQLQQNESPSNIPSSINDEVSEVIQKQEEQLKIDNSNSNTQAPPAETPTEAPADPLAPSAPSL